MSALAAAILGFVTLQRLAELVWARTNTRRLMAAGGYEIGAAHYPLVVALHVAWLAGLWLLAPGRPVSLFFVAIYAGLQLFRLWTLLSIGRRWTTRIIVVPGERLVARGPYRFLRHPNYLVVVGEIAVLPLVFGLAAYALAFSLLNGVVLWIRIQAEERALRVAGTAA